MTVSITVIICSHNPRPAYLERVLDALKKQSIDYSRWELILVDNASDISIALQWDLSWHPNSRHVLEPAIGLTKARLRGIVEAKAGLLVFLDDDNVPDTDYLEVVQWLFDRNPDIGVAGAGRLEPIFEEPPPDEITPYFRFLAIRTIEQNVFKMDTSVSPNPWGAGLCVKAEVAKEYVKQVSVCPIRIGLGRKGDNLISGEDDEFSWIAQHLGMKHGIFRELRIQHLIERRRVKANYLERVIRGNGYSCAMLTCMHGLAGANPFVAPSLIHMAHLICHLRVKTGIHELRRWILYWLGAKINRRMTTARAQGWECGMADFGKINDSVEKIIST